MLSAKRIAMVAALALGFAVTAQAVPINGAIGMAGGYTTDSGDDATATAIDFDPTGPGGNFTTFQALGDLAIFLGKIGSITDFTFNPFSGPINGFYSVSNGGSTLTFDLTSLTLVNQDATEIRLSGVGNMHLTGFDTTLGDWQFTAQVNQFGSNFAFTWSASSGASGLPVPEPGSMALIGLGVMMAGIARRRRQ